MPKARRVVVAAVALVFSSLGLAFAADYVFLSPAYLSATKDVIGEANEKAPTYFRDPPTAFARYDNAQRRLYDDVTRIQREQFFKKVSADTVSDTRDKEFSDALNGFKDAINAMADTADKPLEKLLPSYAAWNHLETQVVKAGLEQRLTAYKTRFGPDSEPINVLELLISQKALPGNEAGPAPWEPILRMEAVGVTTSGPGLTSTIQTGMNYYFLNGQPPKPLQWLTVSNHVGVAAMLQYLDRPGVLELKGRPSFGVMLHLDRKEIGVAWDDANNRFRLTLGYAFQFIPMLM